MSRVAAIRPEGTGAPLARRRSLLQISDNPARRADYMVRLDGAIEAGAAGTVAIALAYIPDRAILSPAGFGAYLDSLKGENWGSIEELGAAILADIESEVVPRYLRLTLRGGTDKPGCVSGHVVLFEGRQPDWKNDAILARLG